jgi:hypothetical protein
MIGHHKNGLTTTILIVTTALLEFVLGFCYLNGAEHDALCRLYFAMGAITLIGLACLILD